MKKRAFIISTIAFILVSAVFADIGIFGESVQATALMLTKSILKWGFVALMYLLVFILPIKILIANEKNEKRHAEFLADTRLQAAVDKSKELEKQINAQLNMEDYF